MTNQQIYPQKETTTRDNGYGMKLRFEFGENTNSKYIANKTLINAWSEHLSGRVNRVDGAPMAANTKGESDAMREFTDSANLCFSIVFKAANIVDYAFWIDTLKNGYMLDKLIVEQFKLNPNIPYGSYVYEKVKVTGISALDLTIEAPSQNPYFTVSFSSTKLSIFDDTGIELTTVTASRHATVLKG